MLRKGETQTWQLFLSHVTPILLPQNSWKSQATAVRTKPWSSEEIHHCCGQEWSHRVLRSSTVVGSLVTLGLLAVLVWTMMSKWQGHLMCSVWDWERFPRAYKICSILHLLSDLGMCRKSFVASHGEVNFLGRNRGKTRVLKKQHPQYLLRVRVDFPGRLYSRTDFHHMFSILLQGGKHLCYCHKAGWQEEPDQVVDQTRRMWEERIFVLFVVPHTCSFPAMAPGHYSYVRISVPVCWAMAPKFLKGCSGHHSNQEQPEKPRVWFMERISMLPSVCASHSWCVHTSAHTALHRRGFVQKIKIKYNLILPIIDNKLIKPNKKYLRSNFYFYYLFLFI